MAHLLMQALTPPLATQTAPAGFTWHLDWQFIITSTIAVAAIAVAVILYTLQRRRKQLTYTILTDVSLLPRFPEVSQDLEISYRNRPIRSPRLLRIVLSNSGNTPIVITDYHEPIQLLFSPNSVVLCELESATPTELSTKILTKPGTIQLDPTLLNQHDSLTLRILLDAPTGDFRAKCRIAGMRTITQYRERRTLLLISGTILTFIGLAWLIASAIRNAREPYNYITPAISLGIGYMLMLATSALTMKSLMRRMAKTNTRQTPPNENAPPS